MHSPSEVPVPCPSCGRQRADADAPCPECEAANALADRLQGKR